MKATIHATMITLLSLSSVARLSADFISPKDNPPFRRDQLPLDVDTMAGLSRHLSMLGASIEQTQPANERLVAQCVAVSIALDPINRGAVTLREAFENKKSANKPEDQQMKVALVNSWRKYEWLSEKETGADANVLAACMGDILAKLDPENPNAVSHRSEKGSWNNWVAPESDFSKSQDAVEEKADPNEGETNHPPDQSPVDTPEFATFQLRNASVISPLWLHVKSTKGVDDFVYRLSLAEVKLSHYFNQEEPDFKYILPDQDPDKTRPMREELHQKTTTFFAYKFGKMPEGGRVSLAFGTEQYYSVRRNKTNLSAAACVLTHACLSGKECAGIVIGVVERDGKLTTPPNIWELIRALESAPASRIILPKAAEPLLHSLIAKDQINFFVKHDIFLANNVEELIKFSLKTPDAQLNEALKQFAEIRAKVPSAIGPFLANAFVQKRLEALDQSCPQYASCRVLMAVGKGLRTSKIASIALAQEIRTAFIPLQEYADQDEWNMFDLSSDSIQNEYEKIRNHLDSQERYVAEGDKTLFNEATDLASRVRTLARSVKASRTRETETNYHEKTARETMGEIRKELPLLQNKISKILGERIPEPEK